jgi:hypothetical protein
MSSCSVCGENHAAHRCDELHTEIKGLKDPQPTGPRGQDDEDDALSPSVAPHPVKNVQASFLSYCRQLYRYPRR